jgi:hypothetical protein
MKSIKLLEAVNILCSMKFNKKYVKYNIIHKSKHVKYIITYL